MTVRTIGPLGTLLAIGLATAGTAGATTLIPMSVDDMATTADTVVIATVSDQQVVRDAGAVNTLVTLTVEETVTGNPGDSVTVRVPGGSFESNGIAVGEVNAGAPIFAMDQEVALFLSPADGAGARQILGYSQGQFNVNEGMVRVPEFGAPVSLERFTTRIQAMTNP